MVLRQRRSMVLLLGFKRFFKQRGLMAPLTRWLSGLRLNGYSITL